MVHHLGGANSPVAYREGPYVLVPKARSGWELFDLANDLPQTKDLSEQLPGKVAEMAAKLEKIKADGRSRG